LNPDLVYHVAIFVLMSAVIIGAGVMLAKSGDRIADVTGLGGLLIGMVLVAAATSLPEIAVAVSAVLVEDSPDLAIGNLLGSNMANMALLAVVDLVYRGKVWQRVGPGHARTAAVAIALTAVATLAILRPFELAIGWVGIDSTIIFIGFISLIAWTHRSSTPPMPTGELSSEDGHPPHPERGAAVTLGGPPSRRAIVRSIQSDLLRFSLAAVIILLAAPVLVSAAGGIGTEAGLGDSFVGASFLAFSTSLPELATALAAVRIGAFDLAVGSLLGSNAFNMAIIFFVDLVYTPGPILAAVDATQAFVGVSAILLMAIVLAGIIHGARTRSSRLEPGSGMTLVTYLILMYMIFSAST
jgi:cation:H+ antiporter